MEKGWNKGDMIKERERERERERTGEERRREEKRRKERRWAVEERWRGGEVEMASLLLQGSPRLRRPVLPAVVIEAYRLEVDNTGRKKW